MSCIGTRVFLICRDWGYVLFTLSRGCVVMFLQAYRQRNINTINYDWPEFIHVTIILSYHLRQLYSVPFLLRNCCTILALPISSEIIDGFWHSRCLNDCIDLFYMIGSFASGANASLVAKIGTKDLSTSCSIYRIWTNRRILTFKVSKGPYWSPLHDRIICKWCQCLLGG